jgi:hypothetical protein
MKSVPHGPFSLRCTSLGQHRGDTFLGAAGVAPPLPCARSAKENERCEASLPPSRSWPSLQFRPRHRMPATAFWGSLVSIVAAGTTPAAARATVVAAVAAAAADVAAAANRRVAAAAAIVASRPVVAAAAASRDAVAITAVNLLAVVGVDATPMAASTRAKGFAAAANGGYLGVRVGAATAAATADASPGVAVSPDAAASPVVAANRDVAVSPVAAAVAVAGRGVAVVRAPGRMAPPATRASVT